MIKRVFRWNANDSSLLYGRFQFLIAWFKPYTKISLALHNQMNNQITQIYIFPITTQCIKQILKLEFFRCFFSDHI